MPKPSLLQTLFREPSQSYTNPTPFDKAHHNRWTSHNRAQSLRSVSSYASQTTASSRPDGLNEPAIDGGQWEWAAFGARKGLTGGPASLRAPSVIFGGKEDDDKRSLRSTKSLGSVRSGSVVWSNGVGSQGALPASKPKKAIRGTSRRYSDMLPSDGASQRARRGSALSYQSTSSLDLASPRTASPNISRSTTPTSIPKTKKRRPLLVETANHSSTRTPSLSSTASSAASSPPITPAASPVTVPFTLEASLPKAISVADTQRVIPLPDINPSRTWPTQRARTFVLESVDEAAESEEPDEKRRSRRLSLIVLPGPEEPQVVKVESISIDEAQSLTRPISPTPSFVPGQILTVDEFFNAFSPTQSPALLPTKTILPVPSLHLNDSQNLGDQKFTPLPEKDGALLPEEAQNSEPLVPSTPSPPAAVPRIRLTRTESDQAASGVAGDITPPFSTEDSDSPTSPTSPTQLFEDAPTSPAEEPTNITFPVDHGQQSALPSNEPDSTPSSPPRPRKSSQRRRSASPAPSIPEPILQVVASSRASPDASLAPSTSVPSIASTASSDASSKWQQKIRLNPDITTQSLVTSNAAPKRSRSLNASPRVIETARLKRPTSLVSLERADSPIARPASMHELETTFGPNAEPLPITSHPEKSLSRSSSLASARPASASQQEKPLSRSSSPASAHAPSPTNQTKNLSRSSSLASPRSSSPSRPVLPAPLSQQHPSPSLATDRHPGQAPQSAIRASSPLAREYTPESLEGDEGDSPQRRRTQSAHASLHAPVRRASPLAAPIPLRPMSQLDNLLDPNMVPLAPINPSEPLPRPPSITPVSPGFVGMTHHFPSNLPPRRRATSVFSDAMSTTQSEAGRSTFSVPLRAYRPMNDSNRPPLDSIDIKSNRSVMYALSVSATAAAALHKSGFSLFKKSKTSAAAGKLALEPRRDLTFGMLQPPPKKLHSTEVLVEVLAAGLDLWDYQRLCDRVRQADGFGFIPGRSFCGRVLETGGEVTKVKRGELVYGLTDLKRSGALAQLLVVDRDNVTHAPAAELELEQIATLPHAGISVVPILQSLADSMPRGSKILILDAHQGAGNLTMQLAPFFRPARDLWIVAQCSPTVKDGAALCRASGASEVIVEEPLAALNSLHESSFDVVLDTIGGRRLYDASRRVLHFEGSFITTVGDEVSVANASLQWKTGIRSLRRSFFAKDKKKVAYWAPHLDRREHTREVLDTLRVAVEQTRAKPSLTRVFDLSDAALAFSPDMGATTAVRHKAE